MNQAPTPRLACVVLGASGHAKVVISTLLAAGIEVAAAFDDDVEKLGRQVLGVVVRGRTADALAVRAERLAIIGVGNNTIRRECATRLSELRWGLAIHPGVWMDSSVLVGEGSVVFAGSVLQPDTRLGRHVIINTAATVDHDCVVGDFVHLAPGVHLAGGVTVGEGAFLGIGAVVIPGVRVGAWATVGAGAVVIRDVPDGGRVAGVPAKAIRQEGAGRGAD